MRLRQKTFQVFEERRNAPEKHPRVPVILARSHVFHGERQRGLLRETLHRKNGEAFAGDRLAHALDVAETGFRPRWGDAQNHHASGPARDVQRRRNNVTIFFRPRDEMVRGQNREQRVTAPSMARVNGGEPNRNCSIQTFRLDQYAFARSRRNLLANGRGLLRVGHRPNAFGGNERPQPRDGLLQHGLFADDVQKLLRRARAAPRPEPRPPPPRKNNGVDCQLFFGLSHWQEKRI